jgi:hypothetical protein
MSPGDLSEAPDRFDQPTLQFGGDDPAQGALAEAGAAVQQHMAHGRPPGLGAGQQDLEHADGLLLAAELREGRWADAFHVLVFVDVCKCAK